MSDLVSYAQLKNYLNLPDDSRQTAVEELLDEVVGTLEAECDREFLPFQAAEAARVEVRDGTGTDRLRLYYPIAVLTSITLGRDPADPVDTLDVADVDVISFGVGETLLTRVDGGVFGPRRSPRHVFVTYDTEDWLPKDAKRAVMSVAAAIVRQFGAEGFKSFRLLDAAGAIDRATEKDPFWLKAVARHRRTVLV